MIDELRESWTATSGKLGGFTFTQIEKSELGYVYRVSYLGEDDGREHEHFEVFQRRLSHKFDFANKVSLPEQMVSYPGDEAFGSWAWCTKSRERALRVFNEFALQEAQISD